MVALGSLQPKFVGQNRSPQEFEEFQQQRRSGDGSEKISSPTRHEERSEPGRSWWAMVRRLAAWKPNQEERQRTRRLLRAGRRFGDGGQGGDVADGNAVNRVNGRVLSKAGAGGKL